MSGGTTEFPPWAEEARRLIDSGMTVHDTCRAVGQTENSVRFALDINGRRAKVAKWREAKRSRNVKRSAERATVRAYTPPPADRPLTLPRISIQTLPDEDKREIKFAPKVRFRDEDPGVTRLREIHRAMIRDGRLPDPALRNLLTH